MKVSQVVLWRGWGVSSMKRTRGLREGEWKVKDNRLFKPQEQRNEILRTC